MLSAALAAMAAAALFAVAAAFQHRSAGLVADTDKVAGLTSLVMQTVRHPLWIAGTLADVAGFGLHALALRDGPLTIVQPLLVTGIVFALPLRQVLEHRKPTRDDLGWTVTLALGLVLFLTLSTPTGSTFRSPHTIPGLISGIAIGLGVLACWLARRGATGRTAAVTLGIASGLAFAAGAGLLKETVTVLHSGVAALLVTWPLYALGIVGAVGLVLSQLAYKAGPLRFSLPLIITVDPIVSMAIGVADFGEAFRDAPFYLVGEALGLALIVAAAVGLTRSRTTCPGSHRDAPLDACQCRARHGDRRLHV